MRVALRKPLRQARKVAGEIVFNKFIRPPDTPGSRLHPHHGDYGHGYFYEEVFCRDSADLAAALSLAGEKPGPILDLAGGAGRLSQALAGQGYEAYLLDRSEVMLAMAEAKRSELITKGKRPFEILRRDILTLECPWQFSRIFSLKNGLEHLESPEQIKEALRRLWLHAAPGAQLFLDVHNLEFCEALPFWKEGKWYYTDDFMLRGQRVRMWSRTLSGGSKSKVVTEHAISHDLLNFVYLSTPIQILAVENWQRFFEQTGWRTLSLWGNWRKERLTAKSHQAIFRLKALK